MNQHNILVECAIGKGVMKLTVLLSSETFKTEILRCEERYQSSYYLACPVKRYQTSTQSRKENVSEVNEQRKGVKN